MGRIRGLYKKVETKMRRSFTLSAAGLEHMNETGVLHLHDGLEVFRNELPLHHLDDGLLCGLVQAVNDPLDFFINSSFHLVDVDTGAVLCQELLALHLKGPTPCVCLITKVSAGVKKTLGGL